MILNNMSEENVDKMVGVTGFEPATFWSQTRRATKLRHTPNFLMITFITETCQFESEYLRIGIVRRQVMSYLQGLASFFPGNSVWDKTLISLETYHGLPDYPSIISIQGIGVVA